MIYLLVTEDKKFAKIGYTKNLNKRRQHNYNTHSPYDLSLALFIPGGKEDEVLFKVRFKPNLKRNEWYYMSSDILDFIESNKHLNIAFVSRQKTNKEIIDNICNLYKNGAKVKDISLNFQRTERSIRRIVERNKAKRKNWLKVSRSG